MFSKPRSYRKIIEYTILVLVCFVLQSVPAFGVRFLGCAPSLLLLLTLGISFFETPNFALWFGLGMGLLSQMVTSSFVGLDGILFMFMAYFTAAALELFLQRKFITYIYVALIGIFLHQIVDYLFHLLLWGSLPLGTALMKRILPTFFFSGLCAFPLFAILSHYDRKFRRQEDELI